MKKINKAYIIMALTMAGFSSCNDYLDKTPLAIAIHIITMHLIAQTTQTFHVRCINLHLISLTSTLL